MICFCPHQHSGGGERDILRAFTHLREGAGRQYSRRFLSLGGSDLKSSPQTCMYGWMCVCEPWCHLLRASIQQVASTALTINVNSSSHIRSNPQSNTPSPHVRTHTHHHRNPFLNCKFAARTPPNHCIASLLRRWFVAAGIFPVRQPPGQAPRGLAPYANTPFHDPTKTRTYMPGFSFAVALN